jgi:hypothetical protein
MDNFVIELFWGWLRISASGAIAICVAAGIVVAVLVYLVGLTFLNKAHPPERTRIRRPIGPSTRRSATARTPAPALPDVPADSERGSDIEPPTLPHSPAPAADD